MAIISAGVIMNVILGLGCFVYAYGQGMVVMPAMVGGVEPASPAYDAGMRAGDEIVAIDGRGDLSWDSMTLKVVLSGRGQALRFEVKRPEHEDLVGLDIQPRREAGSDRPTIGVRPSMSLNLGILSLPAGMKNPPEYPQAEATEDTRPVDTLVSVGPLGQESTPVQDIGQYHRLLARFHKQPLVHVIERREWTEDAPGRVLNRFDVTFPPANFVDFGFRMTFERIAAVRKDSPADRAGFRKGDQIVKVGGRDDVDPLRLPSICYDNAGKPMTIEVERTAADGSKTSQTLTVIPDDTPPWTDKRPPWTELPTSSDVPMLPAWDSSRHRAPHHGRRAGLARSQSGSQGRRCHRAVTIAPPRFVEVVKLKGSKTETPGQSPKRSLSTRHRQHGSGPSGPSSTARTRPSR